MKMSEAFPSAYLKAADLNGGEVRLTIDHVETEILGDSEKPVVYFTGKKKGLVLNKTNASAIVKHYGDDSDDWQGKPIILYPSEVAFQGQMVDAIRVRMPTQKPAAKKPAAATGDDVPFDDDLSF